MWKENRYNREKKQGSMNELRRQTDIQTWATLQKKVSFAFTEIKYYEMKCTV